MARPTRKVRTASWRLAGKNSTAVPYLCCEWQPVLMVIDVPDDLFGVLLKDSIRTEVVGWWIETHDEMTREQVIPAHLVVGVGVNEDVREWCRRISDVATSLEHVK